MKVLGIDPALRNTGLVYIQATGPRHTLTRAATIRTGMVPDEQRLADIHDALVEWIAAADVVACEAQARTQIARTIAGRTNAKASLGREVARIAWTLARTTGRPFFWVEPTQLRRALALPAGAPKKHVALRVGQLLVNAAGKRMNEHEADAAAVAIAGERAARFAATRRTA